MRLRPTSNILFQALNDRLSNFSSYTFFYISFVFSLWPPSFLFFIDTYIQSNDIYGQPYVHFSVSLFNHVDVFLNLNFLFFIAFLDWSIACDPFSCYHHRWWNFSEDPKLFVVVGRFWRRLQRCCALFLDYLSVSSIYSYINCITPTTLFASCPPYRYFAGRLFLHFILLSETLLQLFYLFLFPSL